jgi:hypothetical protein
MRHETNPTVTVNYQTIIGLTVLSDGKEVTEFLPPGPYLISGAVQLASQAPSSAPTHVWAFVFYSTSHGRYYVRMSEALKCKDYEANSY